MKKSNTFPKNYFFSPNFVFRRFIKMLKTYGEKKVIKNVKFQKEREAWITALFLVGLSKFDKHEYWVGIEENESTPDTYGVSLQKVKKGNLLNKMNIEVCEWESHSRLGLAEHINKKLVFKNYPDYYILLCYAHNREGQKVDLEEEYKKLKTLKNNISQIFIVGPQKNKKFDHMIVELYPSRLKIEFKREDEMQRLIRQIDIIKTSRGSGNNIMFLGEEKINFPQVE